MSETALVNACLHVLASRRIFAWRANTGAARYGKRLVRYGAVGQPDIIGILPGGRWLGVECKIGKNPLSEYQENFRKAAEESGGRYWVVRDSVDELMRQLKRIGL